MGNIEGMLHGSNRNKTHGDENNRRPNTRITDPRPDLIANYHISASVINLEHIIKTVVSCPTKTETRLP